VALDSAGWFFSQQYYALNDQQTLVGLVLRYYLVEVVAIVVVFAGAFLTYRGVIRWKESSEQDSVRYLIADALSSRRDFRIGIAVAIVYAFAYLVISSILVYQPNVDFASVYGVSSPGWAAAGCCGTVGTIPALVVYIAPQAHLALQLVPLDLLFAAVVPMLVGFNVTVAVHALRNQAVRTKVGWLGTVGVLVGLFTGCPTCAGIFLAGAIGGLGATSLAVALAPYQVLFIAVSIPFLAITPILVSLNSQRAMRACAIPAPGSAGQKIRNDSV
jgi:hypothetical protein